MCANGFCVCPNGETIQNNVCVTVNTIGILILEILMSILVSAAPGEPCVANVTRCTGNSFCSEQAGICCCPSRQVFLNGQCAKITVLSPLPLERCTPTTVCQGNSRCQNGFCQVNQRGRQIFETLVPARDRSLDSKKRLPANRTWNPV